MSRKKGALAAAGAALAMLASCNFDHAESGDPKDAAKVLVECRKICPPDSTPMALSTIVSDSLYSTHWSCGCLAAPQAPPSAPPKEGPHE